MYFAKKIKISTILAILFINITLSVINNIEFHIGNQTEVELTNNKNYTPISSVIDPRNEVTGEIHDRAGKIFSNITVSSLNCLINRYQPNLNQQPNLFLQDWNITYASMTFGNIKAINYTKDIETNPTEFITSQSETDPVYVYQKFSIETDQYVNNVSIFIQDIIDEDLYTDENSWEVSLVNCSNDFLGTPNSNETLGTIKRPHPNDIVAHWEVFDFKNSDIGPIYLNKSKTNFTLINGIMKYWFTFKIKIPPNDWRTGGGPKFLYLNPDSSDPNEIGEGETFAQSPQFIELNYFLENVTEYKTLIGVELDGNIASFQVFDENRYTVNSTLFGIYQRVYTTVKFEIKNLTNSDYTWDDLKNIRNENPWNWQNILNSIIFSINFSLASNVSDSSLINDARLTLFNPKTLNWDPISSSQINLTQQNESLQYFLATDPNEKLDIIQHMNTTINGNNSLIFRFEYDGNSLTNMFNISINLFTVEIGEIGTIKTIQKYDPIIHKLHHANNVSLLNGTFKTPINEVIESIKENDDNFLQVLGDPDSKTTSIDFKFNILTNLNSSLWDVDDPIDWIFQLPNPIVYQIDIRVSSNVSIQDSTNLTHAMLEIYNGGDFSRFQGIEWFQFTDNKTFADIYEDTKILKFDSYYSWYIMHLINKSDNNSLKMRLRFIGNGTFKGINISVDEFSLNFHVQNAISSDIASKISFGLNSATLKPSDIKMQIFGINITDTGDQEGIWEDYLSNGVPYQGFYTFNVTSIWPEVTFDVSGIYTIEKNQIFDWEYILGHSDSKILWNVSADIAYYTFYTNIENSKSLQFNVPSDWLLMNIYNSSISPPSLSGGWYGTIQSNGLFKSVTVYNISTGSWKVGMNSSKSSLICSLNSTNNVFIDKIINVDVQTSDYYGGDIYFEVYDENSLKIFSDSNELNATALENSASYNWDIYSTTKLPGTYYLKTFWILYNQTHAFLSLNTTVVIVSKYIANLELLNIDQFNENKIIGDDILIKGRLSNNETRMPIEGEVIIAEIYDGSNNVIDSKSDITNNEGLIQIEYTLPEGYNSISIKLIYNTSDAFYTETESIQNLDIIIISQAEFYLNIFLSFLPYIGIILAISLTTVVTMKYRKRKLKRIWSKEALVLDDLLKISHILIIHKDIGVALYSKQISSQELDSDLISGFLHAISQFRSELTKDKERKEPLIGKSMEMDYYDSKIVITDGKNIRVALILDEVPSEQLKEGQLAFTNHFEEKYGSILDVEQFDGDISRFKDADELIETYFNTTLMYPLQLAGLKDVFKLKSLEKALIEVAEQILKEKKFFFISSLLSFGLAGRKESRDQIVSAILSLKNKGILAPIDIQ